MPELVPGYTLEEQEISWHAIRAQGSGGQNVNKVSSAIHLRFDINRSSLPQELKEALLAMNDARINKDGVIIIKAQQFRTQEQNREDALVRLRALIDQANHRPKTRRATRPTKASQLRRVNSKKKQGERKALRRKVDL
ncbi:aminoacyl-tRNA hydrolase [Aestuariibacter halophilus]|uniref:Aminoacyl-tRNA hydrolase n=1 Tax=Fluctibacter halophilus TaxID=226011 RepID=A0ABS8G3U1_9ALTE|nr:alternative ribosome rescue aminoacyl-tRNA hydrolase ArfB [Aestuariibacter halophilus]MCC2615257.1 aminoacyl-tRNA hydrolase [Aestuariibacter halophilus]